MVIRRDVGTERTINGSREMNILCCYCACELMCLRVHAMRTLRACPACVLCAHAILAQRRINNNTQQGVLSSLLYLSLGLSLTLLCVPNRLQQTNSKDV